MDAPHVPVLRLGRPYRSLDTQEVRDPRTGALLATVSLANAGLIARDLRRAREARAALRAIPAARRLAICAEAAGRFQEDSLPLGDDGATLGPDEYVRRLSASTGLPYALCRRNMAKIHGVLARMETVLFGLTRGLDPAILDAGFGEERGVPLSYVAETDALGVVLPSNSPGVNALWLPAIALGVPVVLKPGRADPFTPNRIAQALIAAGCPPAALSIHASDHAGADAVLDGCGRSILFGDAQTTARFAADARVQRHGPGFSKVMIGEDAIDEWPRLLDVIVESIADNGGRSCVNASTIVVPREGDAIAAAIAERLARIEPREPDDPEARLAAFTDRALAARIDAAVETGLRTPGAEDVTARFREGPRLVERGALAYLRPTLVRCRSFDHPLANRELLFPFAGVVEVPQREVLDRIGPTLVVTALSRDPAFLAALQQSRHIDRLNLGPVPTSSVRWDQPHEGNLFDFLFHRRAVQRVTFDGA